MPRRCALTITQADLHAAWLQRRRPSWPPTFELVMADELLRALVRACALGRAQALARNQQRHGPMPAAPQHSTAPAPAVPALLRPASSRTPSTAGIDRKRAAAGDRDDD